MHRKNAVRNVNSRMAVAIGDLEYSREVKDHHGQSSQAAENVKFRNTSFFLRIGFQMEIGFKLRLIKKPRLFYN